MSYIIASLPPIKCFVKREFLYNDHKGHGELEPAIWVSLKALRGQVFRIESATPRRTFTTQELTTPTAWPSLRWISTCNLALKTCSTQHSVGRNSEPDRWPSGNRRSTRPTGV